MSADPAMDQQTPGSVWVIGVGPGDPELLTIRALRALQNCDLVIHAGPSERTGFAFETVVTHLKPGQVVESARLAMKRGPVDGGIGYERVARRLSVAARDGWNVGFLTEGDPMLYGSGSYVTEQLEAIAPELRVEVIPGVCAASAAAARLGWPLAQKDEVLTFCPGTYHVAEIGAILDRGGTTCWLKSADILPRLVEALRDRDRLDRAALVERIGRPDERIFRDLTTALNVNLSYFSLVLVR